MTDNYIELLGLIKKSRFVEGFGTKVETSLMLMLITSLLEEFDSKSLKDEFTEKNLLALFKQYKIELRTNDIDDLIGHLNNSSTMSQALSQELLENLASGFTNYFQETHSKASRVFNLGLVFVISFLFIVYFAVNHFMHPAVAKVTYFSNKNLDGTPFVIEYEPLPKDKDFGMSAPKKGMPSDNFSIRYESDVTLLKDSAVSLTVTSDDGLRVYIDGALVMDYWIPQDSVQHGKSIPLPSGKHRLKIEYFEALVGAKLSFDMTSNTPNNLKFEAPD